jgi:hypothetical protein
MTGKDSSQEELAREFGDDRDGITVLQNLNQKLIVVSGNPDCTSCIVSVQKQKIIACESALEFFFRVFHPIRRSK